MVLTIEFERTLINTTRKDSWVSCSLNRSVSTAEPTAKYNDLRVRITLSGSLKKYLLLHTHLHVARIISIDLVESCSAINFNTTGISNVYFVQIIFRSVLNPCTLV